MRALWKDLRYGVRVLLKSPSFTLVAVFVTALGIGANTAVFSLFNAVLLRPLPYREPQRLVLLHENLPRLGWSLLNVSPAEYLDYKEQNRSLSEVAAFEGVNLNLTGQGEPVRVEAERVSPNLFALLGVAPDRGRAFAPEEDRPGAGRVVVLSYGLWLRQFGADTSVLGRTVRLDEQPYTIVGVMPAGFQFPYAKTSFIAPAELWVPLEISDAERANRAASFDYGVVGRLKPGVTLAEAQADVERVAADSQRQHPEIYRGDAQVTTTVVGLEQETVRGVRPLLLILAGVVGLVLLIACANVASLLLARSTARRREIAVRRALGASTSRLVRQLLTESVMLSLAGGAAGLLLAAWVIDLIKRFGPADVPRLQEAGLHPQALVFTALISLAVGLLFGLAPALHGSRLDLSGALKEAGARAGRGREGKRLRSLLVMFETAAALVLLIGAGLLVNSLVRLLRVSPGFDPAGVAVARTTMPNARYPIAEQSKEAYRRILERVAALPGVRAAAVASNLPLADRRNIGLRVEGAPESAENTAYNAMVSEDYFRTMNIPVLRGRTFDEEDRPGGLPVVVVSESFARRFWPGADAIGKRIAWGGWQGADWLTVVGVVADVKDTTLDAEAEPAVYMPIFQLPRARENVVFLARTSGDAKELAAGLRREIGAVDEGLPVYDARPMAELVAASVAQRRFATWALAGFAAAALLLAAAGLYGVVSYSVTQRTQEIGVRMALGARAGDIFRLVVGQGLLLAGIGVAVGLGASLALTRVLAGMLFGVSAADPLTFAGVSLLLLAVAFVACLVPARRATKVDPLIALRYE
ncbi:MAG TPA: ABC transporter permease [Pyrinomonadaceae bacterium]|jgi:putative ABC transport system permease protein|nr:ABC transporter permease [Pyrinomonadaceae bacterium]